VPDTAAKLRRADICKEAELHYVVPEEREEESGQQQRMSLAGQQSES
jgi:hypothetical protein